MMSLAFFPLVQGVAVTLVHFLWQGALLGLIAWAALRLMRGGPFSRYVTGVVMMAAMLAAPIATLLYVRPHTEAAGLASAAALDGVVTTVPSASRSGPPARPAGSGSAAVIVVLWLAGVAVLSVRLAGGWVVARRCARRAIRPVPPPVHALVRRIAGRLALDRIVRVFESAAVDVPMMIGWIAPVVLLPTAALSGLAPAQLEALVAHELAHVRRHDYLVNLLQSIVETLLFYHPAVWWLSREVRREREHCCDDVALGVCGDRLVYASALADLAALRAPRLALAATDGSLVRRVRRILGGGGPDRPSGWTALMFAALVLSAALPAGLLLAQSQIAEPSAAITERIDGALAAAANPALAGDLATPTADRAPEVLTEEPTDESGIAAAIAADSAATPQMTEQERRALQEELDKIRAAVAELRERTAGGDERNRAVEQERLKQEEAFATYKARLKDLESMLKAKHAGVEDADQIKMKLFQEANEKAAREREIERALQEKLEVTAEWQEKNAAFARQQEELARQFDVLKKEMQLEAGMAVDPNRIIASSDLVTVTVSADGDRLTFRERPIAADGTITLPIVGAVKVAGASVAQAQESLAREFASHKLGSDVSVVLRIPVRR